MRWYFQRHPVFSDGKIDLYPLRDPGNDPALGFRRVLEWKICVSGSRQEIGRVTYRTGEGRGIYYFGHIGYHVDPPWRGNHYALRACLLIRDVIQRSGKSSVIITCDPDNDASRKTCEALGCLKECVTDVDRELQEKYDISARKIRYIWKLQGREEAHVRGGEGNPNLL